MVVDYKVQLQHVEPWQQFRTTCMLYCTILYCTVLSVLYKLNLHQYM